VTLSPIHLQLSILETKAVLVSIIAPAALGTGQYEVNITAQSDIASSARCTSVYRLDIFHLGAALSSTIQSTIQNPEDPDADVQPVTLNPVTQVEGFLVKFRLTVSNAGQRAIAAGSLQLNVWDSYDCGGRTPIDAKNSTCGGPFRVFNWTNPTNIITGIGGSVPVEFSYFAPEYMCFDTDVCRRTDPPPPVNAHRLEFVLTMNYEANTADNGANLTVELLPKAIIRPPDVAAPFPVAVAGAGIGVAGLLGFVFWYRFVRKPKVDEDLYASIYGGEGAPAQPQPGQAVDQYFAAQQQAEAAPAPGQGQTMTDAQLEEARRLYGDDYGR
jgi:hypothetical protein